MRAGWMPFPRSRAGARFFGVIRLLRSANRVEWLIKIDRSFFPGSTSITEASCSAIATQFRPTTPRPETCRDVFRRTHSLMRRMPMTNGSEVYFFESPSSQIVTEPYRREVRLHRPACRSRYDPLPAKRWKTPECPASILWVHRRQLFLPAIPLLQES